MASINISDSNDFKDCYPLDHFYADPGTAQKKTLEVFVKLFDAKLNYYSLKGLFYTTINRYFLADIKIFEHPLILGNIITHCKDNQVTEINFKIHPLNKEVYHFYSKVLNSNNITTSCSYHTLAGYWSNSLTTEPFKAILKDRFKRFFTVIGQFFTLLLNSLLPQKNLFPNKKVVFWHSFANNREKIDYRFIEDLEQSGITAIHPNPYLLKSKSNWNKSIYRLGKYSINPFRFLGVMSEFIFFRKNFNKILEDFPDELPYFPKKWNSSTITKTFFFLNYNLLENGLVEQLAKDKELTVVNLFRGGAAAGLIYAGICKQKHQSSTTTNMLVTHGTEFNVIDHFSYFYLDYNVLPSKLITENWENQLNTLYPQYLKYNHCKQIAGGRIDYQLLNTNVTPHVAEPGKIYVGVVLTYNSETYQDSYISDIITAFESRYTKQRCEFIIKPRPNRVFKPGNYMADNVKINQGDIYSFLNAIDIITGTVSTYGILTMVVTDGIYCDIPGFYYVPNQKFNSQNLGYSYHRSMEPYTFNKTSLNSFLAEFNTTTDLTAGLWKRNEATKDYLVFDKNANEFLNELIVKSLNKSNNA